MTEAVRALVTHVFALTRAEAIYSAAPSRTTLASLRVQEKVGFRPRRRDDAAARDRPADELAHVNTVLTRASFERARRVNRRDR